MYLLEFIEDEQRQIVGVFNDEQDVMEWISSVPFIHKDADDQYTLSYDELPPYYEVLYKDSVYPLTRYAFNQSEVIEVVWSEIAHMDETSGVAPGVSKVGVYYYNNEEVEAAVKAREQFKSELKAYYDDKGKAYTFGGVGSEDGEYIHVEGGPFIHIDPMTIESYESAHNIEQFLKEYQ